jgi:[acyl-carrier-protein] S-malonyltransferase
MKLACVFPGQGSQKVGMCKDLYENFSIAKETFQEVDDALNEKLSHTIFEGPTETLTETANTQPALMVCSIAILRVLEKEAGKKLKDICDYVAGNSLGEFTALTAANSIELSNCARILRIRGKAMQEAVPVGKGSMFALLGANIDIAKEIAEEASAAGPCQVANYNSAEQQVLSGEASSIDRAIALASEKGFKAIKLNVSAPFHSTLMAPAQHKLKEVLDATNIKKPDIPLIANLSANVIDHADIKQNLIDQVTGMVRWHESMLQLERFEVTKMAEVGPGKVYTNLAKRIVPSISASALNSHEAIADFLNT